MDRRTYALVTASYWGFTLTDGALRMLVLLHFHTLGFSPLPLALLFVLYESCGVVTNLLGGWLGSRVGLRFTLFAGLGLQVVALCLLAQVRSDWVLPLSVGYVMVVQALSGVAKDLTKMSSKSAVKLLVPAGRADAGQRLFRWVAVLTGSKNALKGVGFFVGGLLLQTLGFGQSLYWMAGCLAVVLLASLLGIRFDLGKSKRKVRVGQLFARSREINLLSAARLFLFGARDCGFVVGLPVFLAESLGWSFAAVGGFLAAWVIGYGVVQALAPQFVRRGDARGGVRSTLLWGSVLMVLTAGLAAAAEWDFHVGTTIVLGLILFGVVFAINSALHSWLILAYTDNDTVAVNVGFYYMANAAGRLLGTVTSGGAYLVGGVAGCLWAAAVFALVAVGFTTFLPRKAGVLPGGAAIGS